MIKCGDKLEGKPQCILYSKDGSKVLARFPYSKHGGEKGAKAAAHKREGQIQFFKKKSLEAAVEQFGAVPVLAYVAKSEAEQGNPALRDELTAYVEKKEGTKGKPPPGWNMPPSWHKSPYAPIKIARRAWKGLGGSVTKCIERVEQISDIDNPGAFCAALKDAVEGKKWRKGPRDKKEKSFGEEVEEALEMLEKDEQTEEPTQEEGPTLSDVLRDVDLADLEQFLAHWGQETATETKPPPAEETPVTEPPAEETPVTEPPAEEAPVEEAAPEEEVPEEWDKNFLNFIRVQHQRRRAAVQEAIFGPAEEE